MTDAPATTSPASPPAPRLDDEPLTLPIAVYVLYLLGFFTAWLTTLAGVVLAYVQKGDADPRAASHYVFAINTFWISLLALGACIVLSIMGLPLLFLHGVGIVFFMLSGIVGLAATLWFLVRCVVGLVRAAQGEAYPLPRAWLL